MRAVLGAAMATAVAAVLWGGSEEQVITEVKAAVSSAPELEAAAPMIAIPAGSFLRGCNREAIEALGGVCEDDPKQFTAPNTPARDIELGEFWIDEHEVTRGAYARCVTAGACSEASGGGGALLDHGDARLPVTGVRWAQADAYCRWEGKRLPSEAEWEKAARGTDGRVMPWGNALPHCGTANVRVRGAECAQSPRRQSSVDAFAGDVSPYGVKGMAGNVREWVADWRSADAYARPDALAATVVEQAPSVRTPRRVVRGGYFDSPLPGLTLPVRRGMAPERASAHVGFRCARD